MATAQLKTIIPGVQLREGKRGKTIRFFTMVNGHRFTETLDIEAELMLTERNQPTRELKAEYGKWVEKCRAAVSKALPGGGLLREPTIQELIEAYEKIAWKRNADPNYGKPSETAINTAVKNYRYCVEASGLRPSERASKLLDPDMIRRLFKIFCERKNAYGQAISGVTAKSYCCSLQSVTAKWTLLEYRDMRFKVEPIVIPDFGKASRAPEYRELPKEMIAKMMDWYRLLEDNGTPEQVFYATCMLELAVRSGDIGRLSAANFPEDAQGGRRICYVPQKTKGSSNRRVDCPIAVALYEKLYSLLPERFDSGEVILPNIRWVETQVNASLRIATGMTVEEYPKASYELRKLCLHTILHTPIEEGGGVDQAVRLSGDRRDTIEKYYVDPYVSHTTVPYRPVEAFLNKVLN